MKVPREHSVIYLCRDLVLQVKKKNSYNCISIEVYYVAPTWQCKRNIATSFIG